MTAFALYTPGQILTAESLNDERRFIQGYLDCAGYETSGNDIIIRPFAVNVAGVLVKTTADTPLTGELTSKNAGWYGVTVNQAGTVALTTIMTGANTVRPSGITAGTGTELNTYDEAKQGYYEDATTRIIMVFWISNGTPGAVLYDIRLSHAADEWGVNSNGFWTVKNRILTIAGKSTLIDFSSGATPLVTNLYTKSGTFTHPVAFKTTPAATGGSLLAVYSVGAVWSRHISPGTTSSTMTLYGTSTGDAGYGECVLTGKPPSWL